MDICPLDTGIDEREILDCLYHCCDHDRSKSQLHSFASSKFILMPLDKANDIRHIHFADTRHMGAGMLGEYHVLGSLHADIIHRDNGIRFEGNRWSGWRG